MNNMGLPVERRVLADYRIWTPEAFVAWAKHPANAGQVTGGITLECDRDAWPVGDDGATIERHPAVALGHMPKFSPPALPCGNGEHPGGTPAAPSGVSPQHQQAVKARWS